MKTSLIIGGNGFIGSSLVNVLKNNERNVIILDRHPTEKVLSGNVTSVYGDFANQEFLREVLTKNIQEIVVLVYASTPKTSFEDPLFDIWENLPPFVNFLKIVCDFPIEKIVVVSSGGAVYGKALNLPIKENHPTNPVSPYGITKLAVEKYAFLFWELKKLPILCVRPGNAYGKFQKPYLGQGFISTAIASVLQRKPIEIFGESGTIRDYIHVDDLAQGILSALTFGSPGECYNIGSGKGSSNLDIMKEIQKLALRDNLPVTINRQESRPFDVPANYLDFSKLCEISSWSPKISLEDGIAECWEFLKGEYAKT